MVLRKAFENELTELHNDLLRMGSIVEKQIHLCIKSLIEKDTNLANEVIEKDDIVDNLMREIETKSIKIIAKQHPVASDLRFVFTCINIVTDLERIADHAVDIAKITLKLKGQSYIKELIDIPRMGSLVSSMIKEALDAYIDKNLDNAYAVSKKDDEIDKIYKDVFSELLEMMIKDNKKIEQATQLLFVCKFLERIGDHVTNICEWTIYIVTGNQVDLNE